LERFLNKVQLPSFYKNIVDEYTFFDCNNDILLGDFCPKGHQLRPHIVWFGEAVPMIDKSMEICETADILLIIGTSMQVYPAASLIHYVPQGTPIYFIDPKPSVKSNGNLIVIAENATIGMKKFIQLIS
jgi:NAD-dependent deacetylase